MIDWNNRVVRIWVDRPGEKEDYLGSAFFISPTQLLTAIHVVHKYDWKTLRLRDGQALLGGVRRLACKPDYDPNKVDIAVLTIGVAGNGIEKLSVKDCDNPKRGDEVDLLGFNSETADLHSSSRKIDSFDGGGNITVIITDNYVASGMSGGPVIRSNKLVGITQARTKEKNQTIIIPFSAFNDFIEPLLADEKVIQSEKNHSYEDIKWYSALIDKTEQTVYARNMLDNEQKSAFIVLGDRKDWPDAVAYRLAWVLHENRPKQLSWEDDIISNLNKGSGDLLRCLVYEMCIGNRDYKGIEVDEICKRLQNYETPTVFTLTMDAHVNNIDLEIITDFIHYWENELIKTISVKHVLLVIVCFDNIATKRPWFKFGSKHKSKSKDSFRKQLEKTDFMGHLLPEIISLHKGHLSKWKDSFLKEKPHLQQQIEQEEDSLFSENIEISHLELSKNISRLFNPVKKPKGI